LAQQDQEQREVINYLIPQEQQMLFSAVFQRRLLMNNALHLLNLAYRQEDIHFKVQLHLLADLVEV